MKSMLNLNIEVEHEADLPADAQAIAADVARLLFRQLRLGDTRVVTSFGRISMVGPEDGDHVRVFLTGAAIQRNGGRNTSVDRKVAI
jgi:hypothetical protein